MNDIISKVIEYLKEHGINAEVATIYNGGTQTPVIVLEYKS